MAATDDNVDAAVNDEQLEAASDPDPVQGEILRLNTEIADVREKLSRALPLHKKSMHA